MLSELFKQVTELNDQDQKLFFHWVNNQLDKGKQDKDPGAISVVEIRKDAIAQQGIRCPHCKSSEIYGHGKFKGRKRYQCQKCRKTFNELSGTAIDKVHKKDLWSDYLTCMIEGLSLRDASKKTGICVNTAFKWRHRILSSFNDIGCSKMEGIVEADETFFLYSEKGNKKLKRKPRKRATKATLDGMNEQHVNVIVAADRQAHKAMNVGNRGVITKKSIEKAIGKWINKSESILCSDSHRTFQGYAKEYKMPHKMLSARKKQYVTDKIYHTQHVNNIYGQLKKFMLQFNGVSSKYLQNYVNYFKSHMNIEDDKTLMKVIMANGNVYYGTYKSNLHYYAI
jgi:transposase-like protein